MTKGDEAAPPPIRAIQYMGNKSRLLREVSELIRVVRDPARPFVADLFSGTGVVSGSVGRSMPVIGVDIQEYARVLTAAQLQPRKLDREVLATLRRSTMSQWKASPVAFLLQAEESLLDDSRANLERIASLSDNGSLEAMSSQSGEHPLGVLAEDAREYARERGDSTVFRHYGGVFFSYRQALEIDALAAAARTLQGAERDTAMAAVLATASALVTSVGGHFAQPANLRDRAGGLKHGALRRLVSKRLLDVDSVADGWLHRYELSPTAWEGSRAERSDVLEFVARLPVSVGCVYADPPYTREHYSRFYHVLETIASGVSEPGIARTTRGDGSAPSKGLYPDDRYQSPFSIISQAPNALASLSSHVAAAGVPLVVSYSPVPQTDKPRQRVMSLEMVTETLGTHYARVDVIPVDGVRHSRFNSQSLSATTISGAEEVFVVGKPAERRLRKRAARPEAAHL